jgi:hypothetical protein
MRGSIGRLMSMTQGERHKLALCAVVFVLGCVVFTAGFAGTFKRRDAQTAWTPVTALVSKTLLRFDPQHGDTVYVWVSYPYRGHTIAAQLDIANPISTPYDIVAQAEVDRLYPVGGEIVVLVNPANPQEASTVADLQQDQFWLGLLVLVLKVVVLLSVLVMFYPPQSKGR